MDDDQVPRTKFRHGQINIQLRLTWGVNVWPRLWMQGLLRGL